MFAMILLIGFFILLVTIVMSLIYEAVYLENPEVH